METIENSTIAITLISFIISIILIVRWWGMTSDIKDIRNYLLNKNKVVISPTEHEVINPQNIDESTNLEIEVLKPKMKPNNCIIKVKRTNLLEIWDKKTWEEHVAAGKMNYFELMYKNY